MHFSQQNPQTPSGYTKFFRIGVDIAIIENMPVAVYTCDTNGYITFYNTAAVKLWGREPIIGVEKWCGAHKAYTAEGNPFPTDYNPMALMMASGHIEPGMEIIVEQPDGTLVNVMPSPSLIYDTEGTIAGAATMMLDVTSMRNGDKEAQERAFEKIAQNNLLLKQTDERYYRMIEEVKDYAIIMLDRNGIILNWNKGAEQIKGYTEDEIVGRNFRIFYLAEDKDNNLPDKLIENAVENGRASHEGWRLRKDGSKFWGWVVITALHDDFGSTIGFTKVTRDLTERKLTEDRMFSYARDIEYRNKQLEEYAYIASHDLQEPLRKIQVFAEMLTDSVDDKDSVLRYVDKINASAGRMTTLIKDVLKYSQLSNTGELFETVRLNVVLQNVLEDFDLLIEQKKVRIAVSDMPVLKGIPIQLHQLFSNLLGNAIKFSNHNPIISITATVAEAAELEGQMVLQGVPYAKIVFQDNGQGFEQEYGELIFKMFQRLDNTPGTGIGLALCKKIVENHEGFITATGEPGNGAAFSIFLPLR